MSAFECLFCRLARCQSVRSLRSNFEWVYFIPLCFAEVRGHGVVIICVNTCVQCFSFGEYFFEWIRVVFCNGSDFLFDYRRSVFWKVTEIIHLRNIVRTSRAVAGESMSINLSLSVIFYGKGVPRRWYLFAVAVVPAAGCTGPGGRRAAPVEPWCRYRSEVSGFGRDAGGGAAACIHLWPARGERRSRSVRRLKVARHVTRGVHTTHSLLALTPADLPSPCSVPDSRVCNRIRLIGTTSWLSREQMIKRKPFYYFSYFHAITNQTTP